MKHFFWGDKRVKAVLIVFYFLMAIVICSHTYNDLLITVRQSINVWPSIFGGTFSELYINNNIASGNNVYNSVQGMSYPLIVYLTFAVLELPLLFVELLGVDIMNNFLCMVYMKLPIIGAVLLAGELCGKIYKLEHGDNEINQYIPFMFLSSVLAITSCGMIGQYDIFAVVFMLLGLFHFFKKNRFRFLIFFGISICFKYLTLIAVIPLILYSERNYWKAFRELIIAVFPATLFVGASSFVFSVGNQNSSFLINFVLKLFSANFPAGMSSISAFLLVYALVCLWCAWQAYRVEHEQSYQTVIWLLFAIYGAMFVWTNCHPYWVILIVPFLILVTVDNRKCLYPAIILENVFSCSFVVWQMSVYAWCFSSTTMVGMLWSVLLPENHFYETSIGKLFAFVQVIPASVAVAAFFAILLVHYPFRKSNMTAELVPTSEWAIEKLILVRSYFNVGIALMPSAFYIWHHFTNRM